MSQYDSYLTGLKQEDDKQNQVVSSLSEAANTNPDEFANMVKLSRAAKISVEAVPAYKEEAQQAKFLGDVGLDRLWRDAPKTTQFLATPENAKIASDDIENLSGIEGAFNWTKNRARAIGAALPTTTSGLWGAMAAPFELLGIDSVGGYMRDQQQFGKEMAKRWGPQDKPGWTTSAFDSGMTSFGQNMLTLPLAFLPGGQNAALAGMVAPVFGESYGKARDKGLTPLQGINFGAQDAVAEWAGEKLGLVNLVKNVKAGTGLGKTAVQFMLRELPGEMATTVVQSFDEYANLNPDKPVSEWVSQLPEELAQTVIATLVGGSAISTTASGVQKVAQMSQRKEEKAQEAEAAAGMLERINQFISASTTLQRDPETFAAFIEQATEDGPVENVFVDANVLYQSGMADQMIELSPAVASQYEIAIATGQDIRIPVGEYATLIAKSEHAAKLIDHLKVDENGYSRAEATAFMESQGSELEAAIQKVMTEGGDVEAFKQSTESVKTIIKDQLAATQRFTDTTNEAYATIVSSAFSATAARLGITPEALYQRYPLQIGQNGMGGQEFNQTETIDALRKQWTDAGIKNAISEKDGVITLSQIVIPESDRGEGKGTEAMQALVDYADKTGQHIALSPSSDFGGNKKRLVNFYKRFGFVENKGKNRAFTTSESMYRQASGKVLYQTSTVNEKNTRNLKDDNQNILNQQQESVKRGAFSPEKLAITLLKDANLSTFLHESGHFFLEMQFDIAAKLQQDARIHGTDTLTPGEQEYLRDAQTILDWFGVKDSAEWSNLSFEERRSYHERFAESFESYLFSGKAPSIELQPVFNRFQSFLATVYKSIKNFLAGHPEAGTLNDEVRGVFDRMLATQDQIMLAEQGRSMMPLFETAEQAGMSPEQFAEYQSTELGASQEAIKEQQAKGLRDMQWAKRTRIKALKSLQQQAKAQRDELTMQVRKEVMSQPVYRAWQFLTGKLNRDDMSDGDKARADYREELKAWNAKRSEAEDEANKDAKQAAWEGSEEGGKKYQKPGSLVKAQQKVLKREEKAIYADVEKVMAEWESKNPKPNDPDVKPKANPNVVDESADSLFTAIAKLGGINKAETVGTWGSDPADKPQSGVFGKPVWRKEGGLSLDAMLESLSQYGYLTLDENGKADLAEFEKKFSAEMGGDTQYSNAFDYSANQDEGTFGDRISNPEGLSSGRLDFESLSTMGLPAEMVALVKERKMTAKEGLPVDMAAELFGFGSGDEMIRAIVAAASPKDAIESEVSRRMLAENGELATQEAIERSADAAVHNEVRARMVATELDALQKSNGKGRVLSNAAKEFAAKLIGGLKIRDIKPGQYASAGVRAAKATDKAVKAGDTEQAIVEKRNHLISIQATKAAYAGQDEAAAIVRYLSKFSKEGTRKNIATDYQVQIDAILDRFDLRTGQSLKAIDKRESLSKWVESQELAGLEPDIPEFLLLESNRTHYKNLTLDELRAVNESVRQVEHLGRLKNKLLTAKDARELNAIVEEITASMIESSGGKIVDNERRNEIGSKISQAGKWWMAIHRKSANVVREMDGFKDGGPMWEYFIRSMNEAGEREASMRAEAAEKLHALAKPVLEAGKLGGKGKFFPSMNRNLNRGEIIAIALNIGNESNLQRLLGGKGWTVGMIKPALDTLTPADLAFVQGVWDFFESYRPQIAAKQMRVYGTEPDWIAPGSQFLQQFSAEKGVSMPGGYYPVKYDPMQSGKAGEFAEAEEAKAMMRAANTASTTRRSFTKTRAEEVNGRPLLLTFDGIWSGANEVIHDLTWHEWLIDANRLLKRLDDPMRDHFGAEYVDVLRTAVKDAARGDISATNMLEKSLTHVRIGATVAGLGWNLTTSLLQPIGLTQSWVRIGGAWVARGLKDFYSSPIAKAQEIQDKSEFMRNRARTFMREINDVRNRLESDKSEIMNKVEASFFVLIQKMQATVDYPTWLGAYEKAISQGNDEDRSIALADQAVIDSQGGGQIKDLSQVQRGHPAMKLFTNFYSFFNVALNLAIDRTKATDFKKPKDVAALAGDYLLIMVLPSAIGAILKSVLKGGDDDEEKLIKKIAEEQIGFLMGLFVGLREVTSGVQLAFGVGNPGMGYGGPAGVRLFAELQKLGQQIGQGEADMAIMKAANSVAGILFHYPSGQVNRLVEGSAALIDGRTNNVLAPLVGPPPKN